MFMRIEFPQFMKVIKLLSNFKLIVGPIVIMIFLELAFPYFLHKIPLYLHAAIDSGLLGLAQTSKRSFFNLLNSAQQPRHLRWKNKKQKLHQYGKAHSRTNKASPDHP